MMVLNELKPSIYNGQVRTLAGLHAKIYIAR
jgi:hypothetical protein